ncbi:MAG: hypothetical protein ACI9WU_002273 [Myxococcota bacterium]|jgi:hypothetical protein
MNTTRIAIIGVAAMALALGSCSKDEGGKGHVKGSGGAAKPAGGSGGGGGSAKKGAYAEGAVANGGTISGTIKYAGAETDPTMDLTKDNSVCGSGTVPSKKLVAAGGNLEGALVTLDGITSGKAWGAGGTPTVDNAKCIFVPRFSIGKLGAEMVTKNSDPVLHNTHLYLMKGEKAKNLKNIALPNQGQTIPFKMKKPGLMDVRCDAHEWMQGWVWVSSHPYASVTDASGAFTMTDVPAGEYTAKIWHEKLGDATATVKVDAGGNAKIEHTYN